MKAKDFFRKIFSFQLWINLFSMLIVVIVLCLGVKIGIDLYTHHGEEIVIPNVKHKLFADAEHLLEEQGLKVVVSDTGYVKTLPPDCILEQTPAPGNRVKAGRVIYVVINSSHSPMITLPDIIDNCSFREAKAKLIAMGFKVGPAEYVSGEKDWVYGVKQKGQMLQNGQKALVDVPLVIQVGDGMRDLEDSVVYTDPTYYDTTDGDTLHYEHNHAAEEKESNANAADVDEFELVNGPE